MLATLRQRDYALLWVGGLVSVTGDWVLLAALPFYVYGLTGSALASGGMFIANTVPSVLFGSVAGVFVDRWNRQRVMVTADLSRAVLLLGLLVVRSPQWVGLVYVIVFTSSCISLFFSPAKSALLPQLAGSDHLVAANALNGLNSQVGRLLGPALGGALLGTVGLTGVALADSASFVISGLLIARIASAPLIERAGADPARAARAAGERWRSVWRDWLDGLRLVRRNRALSSFFLVVGIAGIGEGIYNVMYVVFVRAVLHGGALAFGWLSSAQAVGGLLGGLVIGHAGRRLTPRFLIALLAAVGLSTLVLIYFHTIPVALGVAVFAGIPAVGYSVGFTTLLQDATDDRYRGRIFGTYGTTWALLALVGQGIGSGLGDRLGSSILLAAEGVLDIIAGVLALALLRRARTPVSSSASAMPREDIAHPDSRGETASTEERTAQP